MHSTGFLGRIVATGVAIVLLSAIWLNSTAMSAVEHAPVTALTEAELADVFGGAVEGNGWKQADPDQDTCWGDPPCVRCNSGTPNVPTTGCTNQTVGILFHNVDVRRVEPMQNGMLTEDAEIPCFTQTLCEQGPLVLDRVCGDEELSYECGIYTPYARCRECQINYDSGLLVYATDIEAIDP